VIVAARLLVAVAPFLLTLLFAGLVMEGHLNFGSGEKDIFLAVPLLLWSGVFFLSMMVLWIKRIVFGRSIKIAIGIATGLALLMWLALFAVAWFVTS